MFKVIGHYVYDKQIQIVQGRPRVVDLSLQYEPDIDPKIVSWINEQVSIEVLRVYVPLGKDMFKFCTWNIRKLVIGRSTSHFFRGMCFPKITNLYVTNACSEIDFWIDFIEQHKGTLKKVRIRLSPDMLIPSEKMNIFDYLEQLELMGCDQDVSKLSNLKTLKVEQIRHKAQELCHLIRTSTRLSRLDIRLIRHNDPYVQGVINSLKENVLITTITTKWEWYGFQMIAKRNSELKRRATARTIMLKAVAKKHNAQKDVIDAIAKELFMIR